MPTLQQTEKTPIANRRTKFIHPGTTPPPRSANFKRFTATLQQADGETSVAINWFSDVSVFDSVDLNTTLNLPDGRKSGTATGDHTFSSTPGHATTTQTLVASRN